ncbi:MAG: peptidoglycan DD-metalloendopeptidase family protein [Bacillota bacterium]|nr:peptidoglycan DD-metalloendopeptidase family protein [Bacillota bacterium]
MRKILTYALVFTLTVSGLAFSAVYADDDEVDEAKLAETQNTLSEVNGQISNLKEALESGEAEEASLNSRIASIESQIVEAENTIASLKRNIENTRAQVAQAQAELDQLQAEMDQQNESMGLRLRSMYKGGEMSILEIILGSESITDLMTNLDMAQLIIDNDMELLAALEAQHQVLEEHKGQLVELQQQLVAQQTAEEQQTAALSVSRSGLSDLKSEVANSNAALEAQIDALNAEANALTAEILALQGTEDYIGGEFAWPAPGVTRVTSEFGMRYHPILNVNKLHTGMDIGCPTGTTIVAANAGTVIKAGWNNSYGWMVSIDHGGGIVTLYAHNSELLVSVGDVVARGQAIAYSGNTGMSTGPHLHFEVRVNGEYKDPRGWL